MSVVSVVSPEPALAGKRAAILENAVTVAIVFTGGTIAMTANKKSGIIPTLSGNDIVSRIPEIEQYLPHVAVEIYDFATLPGPHISPEMMLTLAEFVKALSERVDGVVITHGTDSMEECAYFLDLAIGDHKPVVFTGAMHPSTDAGWDGARNLVDAIAVASSKAFYNQGVLVVMGGTVHAASEVIKSHTTRLDTFCSPDFGQLGIVNVLECCDPQLSRSPKSRMSIAVDDEIELPYIELLKTYSGMDDQLFVATLKGGVQGLVIEAMGQGNVPPGVVNGIARAIEKNIPVVITTRCTAGPVRPYYAYVGAGLELQRLGCLFSPYLTGPKSRIKLMLALAAGYDREMLEKIFPVL
ncbi:MAG: asparaginase [Candidatus Kapaibacterium sp.]|jgi:L-asparaginase